MEMIRFLFWSKTILQIVLSAKRFAKPFYRKFGKRKLWRGQE